MKYWLVLIRMGVLVLLLTIAFQTPVFAAQKHSVKQGETLFGIAKRYGVPVASIKEANRLQSDRLRLNQTLIIPKGNVKTAKKTAVPPAQQGRAAKAKKATASAPVQTKKTIT
ncbi:MAG: LysM peptidoglycan-binding domain-containing protein [Syntrophobacterales bacterium]|jgi:LysM repeat protein|nr:LysM peptidoglycan-binding domain-containing protein [Syntrophobacterales bacterium]